MEIPDSDVFEREERISPGSCFTIVYTSGTTGNPKGVMLSHDNYIWTVNNLIEHILSGMG